MSFPSCAWKLFLSLNLTLGMALGLAAAASATSDSFFDIWVELSDDPIRFQMTGPPTSYGGIQTELVSMELRSSAPIQVVSDPGDGTFVVDSFFDIFYSAGPPGGPYSIDSFFDITYRMSFTLTDSSADHRVFDTEMLSLDLSQGPSGGSDVRPGLSSSPQHRHRGHVTILKLAGGGGGGGGGAGDLYQIDSFLDIFTELSIDGGSSYQPANSVTPFEYRTLVPEPSSAALLALGLAALAARRPGRA